MTALDWTPEEQAKLDEITASWEPGWADAELPTAEESALIDAEAKARWIALGAALELLRRTEAGE